MASRVLVALRVAATPERAFEVFTAEIGAWWRPNGLFAFHPRGSGHLNFEAGPAGRLTEELSSGASFEIGRVTLWEPPRRLVFTWRQASFRPEQTAEVHVSFEARGGETRVTVEHLGWDRLPREHVALHGFPETVFLQRYAEWWQALLASYQREAERAGAGRTT